MTFKEIPPLPDWVKTLGDLEKLHQFQREAFFRKIVQEYQPLGGKKGGNKD